MIGPWWFRQEIDPDAIANGRLEVLHRIQRDALRARAEHDAIQQGVSPPRWG